MRLSIALTLITQFDLQKDILKFNQCILIQSKYGSSRVKGQQKVNIIRDSVLRDAYKTLKCTLMSSTHVYLTSKQHKFTTSHKSLLWTRLKWCRC